MSFKDLYRMCDNLGIYTVFTIHVDYLPIGEFTYMEIPARVVDKPIKGFKIYNETNVEVWL